MSQEKEKESLAENPSELSINNRNLVEELKNLSLKLTEEVTILSAELALATLQLEKAKSVLSKLGSSQQTVATTNVVYLKRPDQESLPLKLNEDSTEEAEGVLEYEGSLFQMSTRDSLILFFKRVRSKFAWSAKNKKV